MSYKYQDFSPEKFRGSGIILTQVGHIDPYILYFVKGRLTVCIYLAYEMNDTNSLSEALAIARTHPKLPKNGRIWFDSSNTVDVGKTCIQKEIILKH